MPLDWGHLQDETVAVQLSFLDTELNTGITLARIALKASDPEKISRNAVSARKARDIIRSYLDGLPSKTPGLEGIRQKLATLERLLDSLENRT